MSEAVNPSGEALSSSASVKSERGDRARIPSDGLPGADRRTWEEQHRDGPASLAQITEAGTLRTEGVQRRPGLGNHLEESFELCAGAVQTKGAVGHSLFDSAGADLAFEAVPALAAAVQAAVAHHALKGDVRSVVL